MMVSCFPNAPRVMRLFPSRILQRLVLRHASACRAAGLDTSNIAVEDDAQVRAWLTARGQYLPTGLVDDLERIDDLTDDRGAAALTDIAMRAGLDAGSLGLDAMEVAIRTFLDHPEVFEAAHARRTVERLRRSVEYPACAAALVQAPSSAALRELEAHLGRHFEGRGRSAHCRITFGRDRQLLVFTVAHGGLEKAEEALDGAPMLVRDSAEPVYLAERTVRYRPERRDVVVYDERVQRLRVRAGDAADLHVYRRSFGELLRGDGAWFGTEPVVSLQPLLEHGRAIEEPVGAVRAVRLVGLLLQHVAAPLGTMAVDSEDIWPYLEARIRGGFDDAELLEATFRVFPADGGRSTVVRVRVPHKVEYGFCSDELFRPYLEARGFLVAGGGRPA